MGKPSGDLLGRVLTAIESFYEAHGYMPTCKQIGEETGVTFSHAAHAVRELWRDGSLRRIRVSERRYVYVLPRQVKASDRLP